MSNSCPTRSEATTFTVNLATLALRAAADAKALALSAGGSSTQGSWIELSSIGSTMPNATLVTYTIDGNGNMLKRDGSGTATSLDDAALAKIGAVAADNGFSFFHGKQSVYLPVGENLKFAVVAGNGQIDLNPNASIGGQGTMAVSISDGASTSAPRSITRWTSPRRWRRRSGSPTIPGSISSRERR